MEYTNQYTGYGYIEQGMDMQNKNCRPLRDTQQAADVFFLQTVVARWQAVVQDMQTIASVHPQWIDDGVMAGMYGLLRWMQDNAQSVQMRTAMQLRTHRPDQPQWRPAR